MKAYDEKTELLEAAIEAMRNDTPSAAEESDAVARVRAQIDARSGHTPRIQQLAEKYTGRPGCQSGQLEFYRGLHRRYSRLSVWPIVAGPGDTV